MPRSSVFAAPKSPCPTLRTWKRRRSRRCRLSARRSKEWSHRMGEFRMPSLGADMTEGTLVQWNVKPGDAIKRGDIIAVVGTEKADIEVEVYQTGTVEKLIAQPGDKLPVGTPIALIHVEGEAPVEVAPEPTAPRPAERVRASPMARKLAQDL